MVNVETTSPQHPARSVFEACVESKTRRPSCSSLGKSLKERIQLVYDIMDHPEDRSDFVTYLKDRHCAELIAFFDEYRERRPRTGGPRFPHTERERERERRLSAERARARRGVCLKTGAEHSSLSRTGMAREKRARIFLFSKTRRQRSAQNYRERVRPPVERETFFWLETCPSQASSASIFGAVR